MPTYVHEASGPDHDKRFEARASIGASCTTVPSVARRRLSRGLLFAYEAILAASEKASELDQTDVLQDAATDG